MSTTISAVDTAVYVPLNEIKNYLVCRQKMERSMVNSMIEDEIVESVQDWPMLFEYYELTR